MFKLFPSVCASQILLKFVPNNCWSAHAETAEAKPSGPCAWDSGYETPRYERLGHETSGMTQRPISCNKTRRNIMSNTQYRRFPLKRTVGLLTQWSHYRTACDNAIGYCSLLHRVRQFLHSVVLPPTQCLSVFLSAVCLSSTSHENYWSSLLSS